MTLIEEEEKEEELQRTTILLKCTFTYGWYLPFTDINLNIMDVLTWYLTTKNISCIYM